MLRGIEMSRRRILPDTVTLRNYVGEVDDEAVYQETILTGCYCIVKSGVNHNSFGRKENRSGKLYIFDTDTKAASSTGTARSYVPYDVWITLADKSAYWTLSELGLDYFKKAGAPELRVVKFSHLVNGTKRMHHFEVDGE